MRISTCPTWKRSNAPSMYTMRAPSGALLPLLNCTMRRLVGINLRMVCMGVRVGGDGEICGALLYILGCEGGMVGMNLRKGA